MGRRRQPPRLWLDQRRGWAILDGGTFIRTGCDESNRDGAEKKLAEYIAEKHKPQVQPSAKPCIAEVLNAYMDEHLPNTRSIKNTIYNIGSLLRWWGDKLVSDITPHNCQAYAATKSPSAARRDLETLRAAVNHWHKWHGPLQVIPSIILPRNSEPRERWLTKSEAAGLVWAARHKPHLDRFILLGLRTGSRAGVLLNLEWLWIDFENKIMLRRAPGSSEATNKKAPKVRLGRKILGHLKRWKRIDGGKTKYVVHYNGQRITRGLYHSFGSAAKAAKLKGVTPHTMRHSRGTWLMQQGIDIWEAAGHLGMTPKMLSSTYGHHHPDFQKSAAEV
jgi:integrase